MADDPARHRPLLLVLLVAAVTVLVLTTAKDQPDPGDTIRSRRADRPRAPEPPPAGDVSGRITINGQPVEVEVTVAYSWGSRSDESRSRTATTDADGRFTVPAVPLLVKAISWRLEGEGRRLGVDVGHLPAEGWEVEADLTAASPLALRFTDPDGRTLGGVAATARRTGGDDDAAVRSNLDGPASITVGVDGESGPDGSLRVDGLPDGEYTVHDPKETLSSRHLLFWPARFEPVVVGLGGGETDEPWTITACPVATVSGSVVCAGDGRPVPHQEIRLTGTAACPERAPPPDPETPPPTTTTARPSTAEDGSFAVAGLVPGRYTLAIPAPGSHRLRRPLPPLAEANLDLGRDDRVVTLEVDCAKLPPRPPIHEGDPDVNAKVLEALQSGQ